VVTSSCATLEDVTRRLPAATVRYRLAGADPGLRRSLDEGLAQLRDGHYPRALAALDRALWDLEHIEKRWLRLEELAEAHRALADTYSALRRASRADHHRTMAQTLTGAAGRDPGSQSPEGTLAQGRDAYVRARFREAATLLERALVDLEDLAHTPARVKLLEEARCYMVFSHFALDDEDRARDELRRLWALDRTLAFCATAAPPAIRPLIGDVQRTSGPR
jgi:tetratricopeptide (TPR) repeat protein